MAFWARDEGQSIAIPGPGKEWDTERLPRGEKSFRGSWGTLDTVPDLAKAG